MVYVVDDQRTNLERALRVSIEYLASSLTVPMHVQTVWLSGWDGFENGIQRVSTLESYHKLVQEHRRSHGDRSSLAHVLDLDNTLFDENQRVARAAANIHNRLNV